MRSSAYSLPSSADANSSRMVPHGCPAARRRRRSDACAFLGSPRSRLHALFGQLCRRCCVGFVPSVLLLASSVFLVLANVYIERKSDVATWQTFKTLQKRCARRPALLTLRHKSYKRPG